MNHRTIQKVKEGLLHDLTHLQPPCGVDRGLIMRHHLESANPGKQKEYALNLNERYAESKRQLKHQNLDDRNLFEDHIRSPALSRPKRDQKTNLRDMNTYIEYLGLNRLSTASTVWSLKNLFMVKTRVMKIK